MSRDYGGAYDISSTEYWSKDDLMELKAAIEELTPRHKETHFDKNWNKITKEVPEVEITAIYLDENDTLDIEYQDRHENEYQLQSKIKIDKRIAGTTKELCEKYAPVVLSEMQKELGEIEAELNTEQEEDWEKY